MRATSKQTNKQIRRRRLKKKWNTDRRTKKIINLIWAVNWFTGMTRKFKSKTTQQLTNDIAPEKKNNKSNPDEMESVVLCVQHRCERLFCAHKYAIYTHPSLISWTLNYVRWRVQCEFVVKNKANNNFPVEGANNLKEVKIWMWTNLRWLHVRHFPKATNQKDTDKNNWILHHFVHLVFSYLTHSEYKYFVCFFLFFHCSGCYNICF